MNSSNSPRCLLQSVAKDSIMDTSSDDSDTFESSKNVRSCLVKSKQRRETREEADDYAYKRRLGDLIFDANFESGNLGHVENVDSYEYDLMVRPDVAHAQHRVWFNFKVSNQREDQCVILTFVNLSENLRSFHEGLCPVIRSRKRPNWVNLDKEQVFFYRSQNHGNRFVLSLAIRFSTQDDEHQLALFYPYSYSTLCAFLDRWQVEMKRLTTIRSKAYLEATRRATATDKTRRISSKSPEPDRRDRRDHDQLRTRSSLETRSGLFASTNDGALKSIPNLTIEKVAESSLFKSIHCVSIGATINDEILSRSATHRNVVIITCRMGGNLDSVASFVCHGLMDYLLSDSLIASAARDCVDFRIFPMLDPDSVCCGNSCTDLLGRQLANQKDSAALIGANPLVYSNYFIVRQRITSILDEVDKKGRAIVMELKVNLNLMGSRILGSRHADTLRMERHLSVPKTMSRFVEDFYLEMCRFTNSSKHSWLGKIASRSNVDLYQFEVSSSGSYRRSFDTRDHVNYDQNAYLKIGKAIVYSFVDLLRPKRADQVTSLLDRFQHHGNDVDDLTLIMTNLHTEKHKTSVL